MPIDNPDRWFLKKYEDGEIFGPVHFDKIREWASDAQVSPQDMVSPDAEIWTKAPMIPELAMDWLIELGDDHYYGPTTAGAVVAFFKNGEITRETAIRNCRDGTVVKLKDCDFMPPEEEFPFQDAIPAAPAKGIIRLSLQKRIRELEVNLLEKRRQLDAATETIHRLENRVKELDARLRQVSGFVGRGD
jgi:hypothetical protein